jgi:L-seryl-tRNA(Ser) seleniumtransferase
VLRDLPSVDAILVALERRGALSKLSHASAADIVRGVVEEHRARARAGNPVDAAAIERDASDRIAAASARTLRPFLNATGILLHTNLGRAPLPSEAREAAAEAGGAVCIELDVETGRRGSRQDHLEPLLRRLTGAEAALVVNNNAAAVLLALTALAAGRDVVVSRGEQVEIGGSFRIPDVMRASGATLVEVGTTNRTRPSDYERALGPQTGILLKVHRSNFRIVGFTEETSIESLAALGRRAEVPVVFDQGSGALIDVAKFGLPHEPTVQEAIAAGADLVAFSGDKLLGGPQAGILVGRASLIASMRRHPLARALRPDKIGVAALAATLRLYLDPARAPERIPVWRMIAAPAASLQTRAERLARAVLDASPEVEVEVAATEAEVGAGALPAVPLASFGLRLRRAGLTPDAWAARLRTRAPATLVRIGEDAVIADLRSVLPEDDEALGAALSS